MRKYLNKIGLWIFSELLLCLPVPAWARWIGVEWCSQVCNKPSIRDRSFITGLWWARRGLPRSVASPGPLIGWPGRKLGCDWLLAGHQCPLSNNDGSLPDSLLSACSLGSSCLRSPASLSLSRCPRPVQQTLCQKIPIQDEKQELKWCSVFLTSI